MHEWKGDLGILLGGELRGLKQQLSPGYEFINFIAPVHDEAQPHAERWLTFGETLMFGQRR